MKGPRSHSGTTWTAKDCGNTATPAITALGRIVSQQVKARRDEIDKLELSHRSHSHQCRPARCADNSPFGDRGINHARLAEFVDESIRDLKRTAVSTYVFANDEHGWITLHLLPDTLADRFDKSSNAATLRSR